MQVRKCQFPMCDGQALLEHGLQRDFDFEKRWPALLGTLQT